MNTRVDPRTKLFIVLCLSSLGLITSDIYLLFSISIISIIISKLFRGDFFVLIKRIRKLLYVFIFIVVIQSIFTRQGDPILVLDGLHIVTDIGLQRALGYIFRVIIILTSGVIISTSSERKTIQGIIQIGLPYEFAFMTAIGIKFLPLLVEQFKDTFLAIQLRGINIKELSLVDRFKITSYIFTPVIASTINKAKKISISVENRAFRAYDKRTSITKLKMNYLDYLVILFFLVSTILVIYFKIV